MRVIVLLLGFLQKMLASAALMGQIQNVSFKCPSFLSSFQKRRWICAGLGFFLFVLICFVFCYLLFYFF